MMYVQGGMLEVQPDHITVLADTAMRAADLDEAKALEAKQRAEEAIAGPHRETGNRHRRGRAGGAQRAAAGDPEAAQAEVGGAPEGTAPVAADSGASGPRCEKTKGPSMTGPSRQVTPYGVYLSFELPDQFTAEQRAELAAATAAVVHWLV